LSPFGGLVATDADYSPKKKTDADYKADFLKGKEEYKIY